MGRGSVAACRYRRWRPARVLSQCRYRMFVPSRESRSALLSQGEVVARVALVLRGVTMAHVQHDHAQTPHPSRGDAYFPAASS